MHAQTVTIDQAGRITVPKRILEALGLHPESEVVIESTDSGAIIRPKQATAPITARIAAMELPVGDWERMEEETEAGCLAQ